MASPRTAHRVCPRCSGPVGLAEMNSTLPVARAPRSRRTTHRRRGRSPQPVLAPASTVMLRNPGPATSTAATPSAASSAPPALRRPAGWSRLLRQLHRDVGGVVVALLSRPLHCDLRRDAVGRVIAPSSDRVVRTSTIAAESWSGVTVQGYRRGWSRPASRSAVGRRRPIARPSRVACRVPRSPVAQGHASVARGIEHWFPVPGAAGSNPAGGARCDVPRHRNDPDLRNVGPGLFHFGVCPAVGRWACSAAPDRGVLAGVVAVAPGL